MMLPGQGTKRRRRPRAIHGAAALGLLFLSAFALGGGARAQSIPTAAANLMKQVRRQHVIG